MDTNARGKTDRATLAAEAAALVTSTDVAEVAVGLLAAWVAAEDEAGFIAIVESGMTLDGEEDGDQITELARVGAFHSAAVWLVG